MIRNRIKHVSCPHQTPIAPCTGGGGHGACDWVQLSPGTSHQVMAPCEQGRAGLKKQSIRLQRYTANSTSGACGIEILVAAADQLLAVAR